MSSSDLFQFLPDDYHDYLALKFAMLNHRMVTIERIDDCRCLVKINEEIGVGNELRQLAALIKLAADFYDTESDLARAAFTITPSPWNPL